MQVHARPVADRDEDHEHAVAGPAANDRAWRLQIDDELSDRPGVTAVLADTGGAGHLDAEDLVQQAADGVLVDCFTCTTRSRLWCSTRTSADSRSR